MKKNKTNLYIRSLSACLVVYLMLNFDRVDEEDYKVEVSKNVVKELINELLKFYEQ